MEKTIPFRICPLCGCSYIGHPAISRLDNNTEICPDCGTRQALESIGVNKEEREHIIRTIHRHYKGGEQE